MQRTIEKIDTILSEIMLRKIETRKFALDNYSGSDHERLENAKINDGFSDEINEIMGQMFQNLEKTNERYDVAQMRPIISNKRIAGKFIALIKRIIRRILNRTFGWYFNASSIRQQEFNDSCVKTLNLMKDLIVKQNEENVLLKNENIHLKNEIDILGNRDAGLKNEIDMLRSKNGDLKGEIGILRDRSDAFRRENNYILRKLNVSCDLALLENAPSIDYFKFENKFRGTRKNIMENQEVYVKYFKVNGGGRILDIGCGRGEFLELMFNNNISAKGIDCYKPFVEYCKNRGFDVDLNDALTYLDSLEDSSIGGIFMSQVVEHLSEDYVRALIATSYKKLKPGCYFILETPNPDCVAAITQFNLDISHIKPVHFLSLQYLFEENNFSDVEKYYPTNSFYPLRAAKIEGEGISNIDEFNRGIEYINNMLFSCRDYALIARK